MDDALGVHAEVGDVGGTGGEAEVEAAGPVGVDDGEEHYGLTAHGFAAACKGGFVVVLRHERDGAAGLDPGGVLCVGGGPGGTV